MARQLTRRFPRLAALASAVAIVLLPASLDAPAKPRDRRARDDLRFGAEMAEKGLWREALFRWQRALESRPGDAALQNNVAVALEALGDRAAALDAYEKALQLEPIREVASNLELARRAIELSEPPDTGATPGGEEPADAGPP